MSFMVATGQKEECHSQDAPVYHIVPYITGGLDTLINRIRTESVPELAEYGYHTNEEGHFEPGDECLMGLRYRVKQKLDTKGHSAVLVLAEDLFDQKKLVVIKVLHSHFYKLGSQESHILRKLTTADPLNHSHTLRLLTTLTFDSHFCMVFEPLQPDPLTKIFQEFPTHRVLPNLRKVGLRLLATIGFLHQQNMIHTDLKPENILLKHECDLDSVHIVDFGNTVNYVHKEVSLYYNDFELQTPLYRAPEVMFGLPFGTEIDMWSLGCILAELYTGEPLFFGTNKEEIIKQIMKLLGPFPASVFKRGKFFTELKQYTSTEDNSVQALTVLMDHLQCRDVAFVELLAGLLCYNPDERLTAQEAACHPFFAACFPVGFLLEDTSSGTPCYSNKHLSSKSYIHSPYISSSIKKKQPSSRDLLKLGTTESSPCKAKASIIKPKPIELLNERRKLLIKKSDDRSQTSNETSGAVISKDYMDALMKAKNEVKFSDNVKEKMSSLLKAIKEEQNFVENDLERKSKEMVVKEHSFRLSSGNKRHGDTPLKIDRNKVVEEKNDAIIDKTENKVRRPKPDNQRNIVVPDVVSDTKHKSNQLTDGKEYIRPSKGSRNQSFSKYVEEGSDLKHERKTFQMTNMLEDWKFKEVSNSRIESTDIDNAHAIGSKHKSRNVSADTDNSHFTGNKHSHNKIISDLSELKSRNSESDKDDTANHQNIYRESASEIEKRASQSHRKNVPRQSVDREKSFKSDRNVSAMFEQMYSEVATPKRNKSHNVSSDENEYVDIISPFDPMLASKRQQHSMRQREVIGSNKKKVTSLNNKAVRPKAVVKPDSWRQSLSPQKNVDHNLERQKKASSSETTVYSAKGQDNYSDSEDMDSDIEIKTDKSQETDADTSQDSVQRKSFDKASENIRNMKHDEIEFTGNSLYVCKENSSKHETHRPEISRVASKSSRSIRRHSGLSDSNVHPVETSHSADSRKSSKDQLSQSISSRNSSHDNHLAINKNSRESTGPSMKDNAQRVLSRKERLVFSHRSALSDTAEQNLTPIPKAEAHGVPINLSDSPEIIYRQKQGSEEGNEWKTSWMQHSRPNNCEKDNSPQRKQKQRKSVGSHIVKPDVSNVADLVKSRTCRMPPDEEEFEELRSSNKNGSSIKHGDPFEFSGTPGTDVKKMTSQGIGERIEQKRSKVKKKARKSLMFEQQNTDDDSYGSDNNTHPIHSSDTQYDSDSREKNRNGVYRVEERKTNDKKYQRHIQTNSPEAVNIVKETHNRKRPLSDDIIRVPQAESTKIGKTLKSGALGQTVHKTYDAAVKKPKLSKAFDITYTIESDSLQQKHARGPVK